MSAQLAPDEIALFPLAHVVLFPRVRTPLFIFLTPHILDDQDFRDLGKLSKAELEAVRADGIDPGKIDAGYRQAFRDQDWAGAAAGEPAGAVRYRSLHK